MIRQRKEQILVALSVPGALLSACSGGGSSSAPSKSVYWAAPPYFVDNTPLVPSRDLQGFEIYIKQDPSFGPADNPVANALALDTTYKLENVTLAIERCDLLRFLADGHDGGHEIRFFRRCALLHTLITTARFVRSFHVSSAAPGLGNRIR